MKKKKGITIIALVVTIIILIILAAIIIKLYSNKSLLQKAEYAKQEYLNAQGEEEIQIAQLNNAIGDETNPSGAVSRRTVTKLWEFDTTAAASSVESGRKTGVITLTDPNDSTKTVNINDYDEISVIVQVVYSSNYCQAVETRILKENFLVPYVDTSVPYGWRFQINLSTENANRRVQFDFEDGNKLRIGNVEKARLLKVCGIKY